jgi:hypothetical protein
VDACVPFLAEWIGAATETIREDATAP